MIRYFHTPPEKRTHSRVMLACFIAAVLLCAACLASYAAVGGEAAGVPGSDAAERFTAQDSPYSYAQLSVCYDKDSAFSLDTVYLNRMNLIKALEENAITVPEGANAFLDAFSGETTVRLSTERKSVTVCATAAGGNYFFFHPLELLDGTYFQENDVNINVLVLDEYAAWQLFGATEVAGMQVTLDNQPFYIAGVCRTPKDIVGKTAYGDTPRIWVHYSGLRNASGFDRALWYEIVLPNPIEGFASSLLKKQLSIPDNAQNVLLNDNTERFRLETLLDKLPHAYLRAMRTDSILPPYWENIARAAESKALVLSLICFVSGVLTLIFTTAAISLWFVIHPIKIKDILGFFDDKIERVRMKRWLSKQKKAAAAAQQQAGTQSQTPL